jgi:hypothetical protein
LANQAFDAIVDRLTTVETAGVGAAEGRTFAGATVRVGERVFVGAGGLLDHGAGTIHATNRLARALLGGLTRLAAAFAVAVTVVVPTLELAGLANTVRPAQPRGLDARAAGGVGADLLRVVITFIGLRAADTGTTVLAWARTAVTHRCALSL